MTWLFIFLATSIIAALAFGAGFQLGRQSPREPAQPDQPLIWPSEATRRQQAAQRALQPRHEPARQVFEC